MPNVPPREVIAFARKRPGSLYGVKTVGSFVPGLTRKAFEKYGFSAATLITDWATIVGKEMAIFTAPERLKWPRNVERSEEGEEAAKGRPGATLVLRVDGARALDVQYKSRQIIERINAYFGYAAVAELRIVQGPVDTRPRPAPIKLPAPMPPLAPEIASVADADLREALARLSAGIKGRLPG